MRLGRLGAPDFEKRFADYPEAVRATGLFHDKQSKHSSYGRCGDCRHLAACSVCPMSIGHTPGNEDPNRVPDFACAFNLVSLDARSSFLKRLGLPPTASHEDYLVGRLNMVHDIAGRRPSLRALPEGKT